MQNPSLPLHCFGGQQSLMFLGLQLLHSAPASAVTWCSPIMCLCLHMASPLCFIPHLARTPDILDEGLVLLQYELIHTITSAKTQFPRKVTFIGTGVQEFKVFWEYKVQSITPVINFLIFFLILTVFHLMYLRFFCQGGEQCGGEMRTIVSEQQFKIK